MRGGGDAEVSCTTSEPRSAKGNSLASRWRRCDRLTTKCLGSGNMLYLIPNVTVGSEELIHREPPALGTDSRSSSQLPRTAVIGCRTSVHVKETIAC